MSNPDAFKEHRIKPGEILNPGGRPVGALGKVTKKMKEAIEFTFNELGGAEGMAKWADKNDGNREIFYRYLFPLLVPKMREISGPDGGDIPFKMPKIIVIPAKGEPIKYGDKEFYDVESMVPQIPEGRSPA